MIIEKKAIQEAIMLAGKGGKETLDSLCLIGGLYKTRSEKGRVVGPLVAYREEYEPGQHYVGYTYANFSILERYPRVIEQIARLLFEALDDLPSPIKATLNGAVCCGIPCGGVTLAQLLALELDSPFIYLEKKPVLALDGVIGHDLCFSRHRVTEEEPIIIVDDVCHNFHSAKQAIEAVTELGGRVVALVCILDRSIGNRHRFVSNCGKHIPIISAVKQYFPEYRQDYPPIANLISRFGLIKDPKARWEELITNMAQRSR